MAISHRLPQRPVPQNPTPPVPSLGCARPILGLALLSGALVCLWGPAFAQDPWQPATRTDRNARRDYVRPVLVAAFDGAFERIEKLATEARENRATLPGGEPKLSAFYSAFQDYDGWNQQDPENHFPKLFASLERWRMERPEAPTPHVALAALYATVAHAAIGYAYSRPDEPNPDFSQKEKR